MILPLGFSWDAFMKPPSRNDQGASNAANKPSSVLETNETKMHVSMRIRISKWLHICIHNMYICMYYILWVEPKFVLTVQYAIFSQAEASPIRSWHSSLYDQCSCLHNAFCHTKGKGIKKTLTWRIISRYLLLAQHGPPRHLMLVLFTPSPWAWSSWSQAFQTVLGQLAKKNKMTMEKRHQENESVSNKIDTVMQLASLELLLSNFTLSLSPSFFLPTSTLQELL